MLFTHSRARAMLVARGGAGRPPCAMPPRCRSVGIGDSLSEREPSSFTFDSYRCTFVLRFVLLYFRTALRIYLLTPSQKKGGCRLALGLFFFSRRPRAVTPVVARLLVALLALSSLSNRSLFIVGWLSRSNLRASFPLNTNVCALQAIFGLLCAFAPKVI